MVLDPVSAAATTAIIYQSAIGTTAALGSTTMIITRFNAISSWWRRKIHGSGTYRIVFGNTCPRPQEHRLMKYLANYAASTGIRFLQSYSFKTSASGPVHTIDVPTRSFLLKNVDQYSTHIYVQPLITSSGQVGGYQFWSYSWFWWNASTKYQRMMTHIKNIMKPPQPAQTFNPVSLESTHINSDAKIRQRLVPLK